MITLIEILIVMFLIALITGVVAYNYRGSLDEGKAFKTKAGMEKLETILNLTVAEDPDALDEVESNWKEMVRSSPLVKDPKSLEKDGWGNEYEVTVEDGVIHIRSDKFEDYKKTNKTLFKD